MRAAKQIELAGTRTIPFDEPHDLLFERAVMYPPGAKMQHPNGLRLTAFDAAGETLVQRTFFSIGGGFIVEDGRDPSNENPQPAIPFPFHSSLELLALAHANELGISQLMLENECALAREAAAEAGESPVEFVRAGIDRIWSVMQGCVERGIATEGILPGGLGVHRRAHRLAARLRLKEADGKVGDPLAPLDWVTVYAMAVNEENAAGGRDGDRAHQRRSRSDPRCCSLLHALHPSRRTTKACSVSSSPSRPSAFSTKRTRTISGAEAGCQGESRRCML